MDSRLLDKTVQNRVISAVEAERAAAATMRDAQQNQTEESPLDKEIRELEALQESGKLMGLGQIKLNALRKKRAGLL